MEHKLSEFISKCESKGIIIGDRKDYLIGFSNYLDEDLLTWNEATLYYTRSLSLPEDDSVFGRFLSLAARLSQGWRGYVTDSDLFNQKLILMLIKELYEIDLNMVSYFNWSLELSEEKYIKLLQVYWDRLSKEEKRDLLGKYLDTLTVSIIDVFDISLNRKDFNSIFDNLDPDLKTDLIKFDLI